MALKKLTIAVAMGPDGKWVSFGGSDCPGREEMDQQLGEAWWGAIGASGDDDDYGPGRTHTVTVTAEIPKRPKPVKVAGTVK